METYTTCAGDTWDGIAYKAYGNELYADKLMAANLKLLNIFVFSSGVIITIPELEEEEEEELPPWRY